MQYTNSLCGQGTEFLNVEARKYVVVTVINSSFLRRNLCVLYRVIHKSLRDFRHTSNVCGRNLITGLTAAASPRLDISSTCKVGQKLGVSLFLLTCSPSGWPSRLLYRRGRKSRRDLWITLNFSTLSHIRHDFRKPLLNIKCVFRVSVQLLYETFFILRRPERDMIKNVYWSSCKITFIIVRF